MGKKRTFFQQVGTTKIIPISVKLVIIFISLLLLSNFATNFITLQFSQRQIFSLSNDVMVSQLKDMYATAGNQFQIYAFTGDKNASLTAIQNVARNSFAYPHSIGLAFDKNGKVLFCTTADGSPLNEPQKDESGAPVPVAEEQFPDAVRLAALNAQFDAGITDGSISFKTYHGQYFGVYKYQDDWNCYFVRAELRSDTVRSTFIVLGMISLVIVILVFGFLYAGLKMFGMVLENVKRITDSLYTMQQKQHLSTIDLSDSPNDDVTYLAASFNALSSTINNLLGIFQKFVSKDVVKKAYDEHTIRLEGNRRELAMLFSDIKSFTYRTETLGTDIIDLLNVHYDRAIHAVHENKGVVGSIIGDAILAIYGAVGSENKSFCAVRAAWDITRVTAQLRTKMIERRAEIEKTRTLTASEERVYQAVLIDVGVGIDGGTVFYGNIGSDEHMTNTVIGDTVNSASRLEGLTRVYNLPVIVSAYIKEECEQETNRYHFYEIDTVQVKGKTEGKKIYYPMDTMLSEKGLAQQFDLYEKGLAAYYDGDWTSARKSFKACALDVADVFLERIGNKSAPAGWSGIWTMTTK